MTVNAPTPRLTNFPTPIASDSGQPCYVGSCSTRDENCSATRQARELHRVGGSRNPALLYFSRMPTSRNRGSATRSSSQSPAQSAAAPAGELGQLDLVVLPRTPHYHRAHAEGPKYDRANA